MNLPSSTVLVAVALIAVSCARVTSAQPADTTSAEAQWTQADSRAVAAAYNDSTRWQAATLAEDVALRERLSDDGVSYPLTYGAHPIPDLATAGLGLGGLPLEVAGRPVIGVWGLVGRDAWTADAYEEAGVDEGDAFAFSIFVLADGDGAPPRQIASSRSRPHFVWMGTLNRSSDARVDYVAFHTADDQSWAMINGRLFDLRVGRSIWVLPMADGSIRYHQELDVPFLSEAALRSRFESFSEREDVRAFFGQDGAWTAAGTDDGGP